MNQIRNDLKPMNIGDVLDYSVEAFRQNFKGIVLISLILYIPWIVFYSLTVNILADNQWSVVLNMYKDMLSGNYSPEMYDSYFNDPSVFGIIMTLLMSMLQMVYSITIKLVLNAAVIKMIYDYAISREIKVSCLADARALIKSCFGFLPRLMGNAAIFVMILGAVYSISLILGVLVIIVPIIIISNLALPPALLGIITIFLILFVLIGFLFAISFFAIKLIFGANIIVLEGKTVSESLTRSFYLTKGKFLYTMLSSVFAIMLYYLFNSLLLGATMLLAVVNNTLYIVVNTFAQMCVAMSEPFILVFITILFINMKVQKEGLDLELKMRKLIEDENENTLNLD